MKDTTRAQQNLTAICLKTGQRALRQIRAVRTSVLGQFRDLVAGHERALRLALNEAEALAFQTPFPHLVFADLAEEKARALAAWLERQRVVRA